MSARVAPSRCPHCLRPLPQPVSARVLDAARALARLGHRATAVEIADALGVSRRYAAQLLARAADAGLVAPVGQQQRPGAGQRATLYAVRSDVLRAFEDRESLL